MLKKKHPKVHIPKAKAPVVKMPKAEAKGKVMTPKVPGVNVKAHVRKPRVVHPGNPMSMSSADYAAHNDARTLKEAAMIHADPVRHKKARKHIDAELTALQQAQAMAPPPAASATPPAVPPVAG